jgi:hypothetical protein
LTTVSFAITRNSSDESRFISLFSIKKRQAQHALVNNPGFFFLRVGGGEGGGDRDFLFFPLFPMGSLVQVSIENVYHVLINSHYL